MDKVTQCVENGDDIDVVYLDFAKAFDKVPHQRLLLKLRDHGIGDKVVNWVSSWLSQRQQRVYASMGNSQLGSLYGVESRRDLFLVQYFSLSPLMT